LEKKLLFLQKLTDCLGNVKLAFVDDNAQALFAHIDKGTDGLFQHLMQQDESFWSRFPTSLSGRTVFTNA